MSGTRFSLVKRNLRLEATEFVVTPEMSRLFFTPYAVLMKDIYTKYFDREVARVSVRGRSRFYTWLVHLRGMFRNNKVAIFMYYKILGKKYNGRGEERKI
jgi:hypothetical protein